MWVIWGRWTVIYTCLIFCEAKPIADTKANNSIVLPDVVPQVTTPVKAHSQEQILKEVARIMKNTQKLTFRYGKRSVDYFQNPELAPIIDEIAKAALHPTRFPDLYFLGKSKRDLFATVPGYHPTEALMRFMRFLMWKERKHQKPCPYKGPIKQKNEDFEKLAQALIVMEDARKSPAYQSISNYYKTTKFLRSRPGKRSVSLNSAYFEIPEPNPSAESHGTKPFAERTLFKNLLASSKKGAQKNVSARKTQ